MAARESNPPSSRVPLRRLSTKRFKTLQARREDAARRRARRALSKPGVEDRMGITWDDVKDAREQGVSWSELAAVVATAQDLNRRYEAGQDLGTAGRDFWASRDSRFPDSVYYYHGIFR